jgi:hypothetical protein
MTDQRSSLVDDNQDKGGGKGLCSDSWTVGTDIESLQLELEVHAHGSQPMPS